MDYTFREISQCNMCKSDTSEHKVLGKRLNSSQGLRPKRKKGICVTICKCNSCGLIYSNPLPIPADIQNHYGVPPEDYWKESYFQLDDSYFQSEIQQLNELMDVEKGMKSLDIGAGLGKQMIALERAGFDAYGFEPSTSFHERAISKMNLPPDKLKLGMIEEVDYEANSFDFVSFGAVLEHLYDPAESIEKALKWTKPNGLIHIEVPSARWLSNKIYNLYYRLILTDYVGNLSPMHEPYHLYEFDINSFRKHAEDIGYKIAHHEYYICQTYLPGFLDPLLKPIMKMSDTGLQLCVWLRKIS